ncbi:MAG: hypothetical protein B7Y39_04390 [Bdellovibrio sp. 28-41-41]|nr:MAG: hypothetical protein B7Y39_04390 [Bdellovibrio sp. 28-41-41]
MKTLVRFTSLILMAGVLSSCYYTRLKTPATVVDDQKFGYLKPAEKMSMMNYDFIGSRILKPRCIACHDSSKNVNLETYDLVKSNLLKIKNAVFIEESMPKRGSLTDEEKRLLWNWILLDAPFQSEQTPPQEEPMVATYDSIRMHIFEPICSTCHNPDGTGKRVLLDRQSLLDSPLVLIDLENNDESGLLVALERKDDKRMPPAKEGYSALKPEQIEIIREWIKNGAN